MAEEMGAKLLEFLDGVGGVEGAGWWWGSCLGAGFEAGGYGVGGGLGGVDDSERVAEVGEGLLEERTEKGVVGAAEEQGGEGGAFPEGFGEVDASDLAGDGMVDPALFDEGDEQGAGFFGGGDAEAGEGLGVGVGLDGGGGGEDEDLGCSGVCVGRL